MSRGDAKCRGLFFSENNPTHRITLTLIGRAGDTQSPDLNFTMSKNSGQHTIN